MTSSAGIIIAELSLISILLAFAAGSTGPYRNKQKKQNPPNILLLLADDLGYGEVEGYYPNSQIQTPRLSKLQEEGM